MVEPPRIPRKTSTPEEGSFDALRDEGIRALAEHSGERWTDYNLHDPGITILEQVCYALTDLIYRAGFDVADHLTGPDGTIDFERQSLHLPMQILPSRPTTAADVRSRLLQRIEGLEDAWILPSVGGSPDPAALAAGGGLHVLVMRETPFVAAREPAERAAARAGLRADALRAFLEGRNLCEDLAGEPVVAEAVRYRLVADLEIAGTRPAVEILEDVYNTVETHVAGRPTPDSAARRQLAGATLDELLTGPSEETGISLDAAREHGADYIFLPDVVGLIRAIRGVASVRDVSLDPVEGPAPAPAATGATDKPRPVDAVPRLMRVAAPGGGVRWLVPVLDEPPPSEDAARVRLWKDGRPVPEPSDFRTRYHESSLKRRRLSRPYEPWASIYGAPTGVYRNLGEYHSIQEQFPEMYGIGPRGLRSRSSLQERAGARQLKAYLLVLEQLMANYASNLQGVRELFSWDDPLSPTYRYQALDEHIIPGMRLIYADLATRTGPVGPYLKDPEQHLAMVRDKFDDRLERRSRLYDQMLAMFGEAHEQSSLVRFGRPDGKRDVDGWMVENKARYLRDIVRLTRDRVGALDYSRPPTFEDGGADPNALGTRAEPSGFARRLGLILGIDDVRPRALGRPAGQPVLEGLHVIEHLLLRPSGGGRAHAGAKQPPAAHPMHPDNLWADFYPSRMSIVLPAQAARFRIPAFRLLVEETVRLNAPAHVLPTCFWLDPAGLQRFETLLGRFERLYGNRLGARLSPSDAARTAGDAELDAAAYALVTFLLEARFALERALRSEASDGS